MRATPFELRGGDPSKVRVPTPDNPLRLLSLGAGVQSSYIAHAAASGEMDSFDAAIFADTGDEPEEVYRWLTWLEDQIAESPNPFPILRVARKISLSETCLLPPRVSKKTGEKWTKCAVPVFLKRPDGTRGFKADRKCTADWKVGAIDWLTIKLAKPRRGEREVLVIQSMGIDYEEMERMKEPRKAWVQNVFPLVDAKVRRKDCKAYFAAKGLPEPPRSACRYCPMKSPEEWRRLKKDHPADYEKAAQFEEAYVANIGRQTGGNILRGIPYLSDSLTRLRDADWDAIIAERRKEGVAKQAVFDFRVECEGLCGV